MEMFEKWCSEQRCSKCKYVELDTREECRKTYYMERKTSPTLISLEEKIDAIIRHFHIKVD